MSVTLMAVACPIRLVFNESMLGSPLRCYVADVHASLDAPAR